MGVCSSKCVTGRHSWLELKAALTHSEEKKKKKKKLEVCSKMEILHI